jgi:release factor glutamine methyltransferase
VRDLAAAGDPDSARDALELLRLLWPDAELASGSAGDAGRERRFGDLVRLRAAGTPLARLTGQAMFLGRRFTVTDDVLVPREHTTGPLVRAGRAAVRLAGPRTAGPVVLADAGTGSGNVVISITAALPPGAVLALATDLSPGALGVARVNIGRFGLGQVIALARMDLVAGLSGRVDVLVANLPYVARPASRLASEPPVALLGGGGDGLALLRRMIAGAGLVLSGDGYCLLEIPPSQAFAALRAARCAFPCAVLLTDRHGVPRVLAAGGPHDPEARMLVAAIDAGAGQDAGPRAAPARHP